MSEFENYGNIQGLQDGLANMLGVCIGIFDPRGDSLTNVSNSAAVAGLYIGMKSSNDGNVYKWDKEIPMVIEGRTLGTIRIARGAECEEPRFEQACDLIEKLADYMLDALKKLNTQSVELNYRKELERRLEQRNEHDMLTNLYNRYYYEKKLTEVILEDVVPVSIAVIDANLLKLSNDIFGHTEGDLLLQLISGALVEEQKENYYCCRCGGDEFYVIMVNTDEEEAKEYLRRVTERTANDYCTRIPPSFAYGVATRKNRSEKMLDVLKQAEDEMYLNKLNMKCDGKILEVLRKCLVDTGHFNLEDALRGVNLALDFTKYLAIGWETIRTVYRLLKLYPLGMLIIPADVMRMASSHIADKLADKYDYVGIEHRIAMMFEDTAPVAHYVIQIDEKWDGTGKPAGLKGEEINIAVRITKITTTYMKYTGHEPFGYAMSKDEAKAKMMAESGKIFDPELLENFFEFIEGYEMRTSVEYGIEL